MATRIEIDTSAAQASVDNLAAKVEGLGPQMDQAATRMESGAKSIGNAFKEISASMGSLGDMVKGLTDQIRANERLTKEASFSTRDWAKAQKILTQGLGDVITAIKEQTTELTRSKTAYQSVGEAAEASEKKQQSAAEKLLAKLRAQNELFAKSDEWILRNTKGWGELNAMQQAALTTMQKFQRDAKLVQDVLTPKQSTLDRLYAQADALKRLNQIYNSSMRGPKGDRMGISDAQFAESMKYLRQLIVEEENLQSAIRSRNALAAEAAGANMGKGMTDLIENARKAAGADAEHTQALREKMAVMQKGLSVYPQTAEQLARMEKGYNGLTVAEQKHLTNLKQLQMDIQRVSKYYKDAVPPIERYQKAMQAANNMRAQGMLTTRQFMGIQRSARKELIQTTLASGDLNKGLMRLLPSLNLMNQGAASGRAAMMGLGQSFGIFTGRTIAVAGATYAFAKAIQTSIVAGMEFEYAMTKIGVMMSDIGDVMSRSFTNGAGMIAVVRDEILRMAAATQFNAIEVAEAAEILARSGMNATQIYSNLEGVLDLAAVGMVDMARAADIATGVMAAFSLEGAGFTYAVDVLAATSVKTKATVDDLGMSLQYIGPIAAQAGIEFHTVAAALGTLAEANIRGSKAGTAMRRIITNLLSPTAAASKAFERMSIDLEEFIVAGEVQFEALLVAMNQQGATIKDLRDIWGQYAVSAAAAMVGQVDVFQELNETLANVEGYSRRAREEIRKNLKLELEELTSTWQAIQVAAYDAFGQGIRDNIVLLTGYLRENSAEIASWIAGVVEGVISIVQWLVEWRNVLIGIAEFWAVLTVSSTIAKNIVGLGVAIHGIQVALTSTKRVTDSVAISAANYTVTMQGASAANMRVTATSYGAAAGTAALGTAMGTSAVAAGRLGIALKALTTASGIGLLLTVASTVGYYIWRMRDDVEELEVVTSATSDIIHSLGDSLHTLDRRRLHRFGDNLKEEFEKGEERIEEFAERIRDLHAELDRLDRRSKPTRSVEEIESEIASIPTRGWNRDQTRLTLLHRERSAAIQYNRTRIRLERELADAVEEANKQLDIQNDNRESERLRLEALAASRQRDIDGILRQFASLEVLNKRLSETGAVYSEISDVDLQDMIDQLITLGVAPEVFDTSVDSVESWADQIKGILRGLYEDMLSRNIAERIESAFSMEGFDMENQSDVNAWRAVMMRLLTDIQDNAPGAASALDLLAESQNSLLARAAREGLEALREAMSVLLSIHPGRDDSDAGRAAQRAFDDAKKSVEGYFQAYERGAGSAQGAARELSEVQKWVGQIEAGSGPAVAAMKEFGYDLDEARKAMAYSEEETILTYAQAVLSDINPQFRELTKTVKLFSAEMLTADEALAVVLESLEEQGYTISASMREMLEGGINRTIDGSAALAVQWNKLVEEATKLRVELSQNQGFEAMVQSFVDEGIASEELARSIVGLNRVHAIFGQELRKVIPESEQMADAQAALLAVQDELIAAGIDMNRLMRQFEASLPTGALRHEADVLQHRLLLVGANRREQDAFNAAVSAYGANWREASDDFIEAAGRVSDLTAELKAAEEIQKAWESTGEGILGVIADVASGMQTSFSGAVKSIKDLFQNLLRDLIFMALRNRIIIGLGIGGTGGSAMAGALGGGGGGLSQSVLGGILGFHPSAGGGGTAGGGGGLTPTFLGGILSMGGGSGTASGNAAAALGQSAGNSFLGTVINSATRASTASGNAASTLGESAGNSFLTTVSSNVTASGSVASTLGESAGNSFLSTVFDKATWVSMGKKLFPGIAETWAKGIVSSGKSIFGSYTGGGVLQGFGLESAGTFTPTALGLGTAVAAGVYAGYSRFRNTEGGVAGHAAGLSYGIGTGVLAMGVMGAISGFMGAGIAGAMSGGIAGMGTALGALGPIGWIAAIAMVVDMFTGGKLFGTANRVEAITQSISSTGEASATETLVRQRSMFRGRRWSEREGEVSDEAEQAAFRFWNSVRQAMRSAANRLGAEMPEMVEGVFNVKTFFDKKGNIEEDKTEEWGEILGRRFDEDFEQFQKRVKGFNILNVIANQLTADQIGSARWNEVFAPPEAPPGHQGDLGGKPDRDPGISPPMNLKTIQKIGEDLEDGSTTLEEVAHNWGVSFAALMGIASRWEASGDMFLDGANFLLNAAVDLVRGMGLLGEDGTLEQITNLVEEYQTENESLVDTYARMVQSVRLTDTFLSSFGATMDRTREEYVRFSADLIEGLGGLPQAQQMLETFFKAFGDRGSFGNVLADQAQAMRSGQLARLGLDPNITADQFVVAFEAALAEGADGFEIAQWIEAGQSLAQVELALRDLREDALGLGDNLAHQLREHIEQIALLGATEAELAEAREYADMILQNARDDILTSLEERATGVGNSLVRDLDDQIKQLEALETSEDELAQALEYREMILQNARDDILTSLKDAATGVSNTLVRDLDKQIAQLEELEVKEEELAQALEYREMILQNARDDILTSLEERATGVSGSLVRDLDKQIAQLELLEASEYELARARDYALQVLANARRDILESLQNQALGGGNNLQRDLVRQIKELRELGATEQELADARSYALQIMRNALDEFMDDIYDSLGEFEGTQYIGQFRAIDREMERNIRTARQLGASEKQLADIRRLAAYQTAQLIAELSQSIMDMWAQLRGVGGEEDLGGSGAVSASNDLYEAERRRYEMAQDAIERIGEYLMQLRASELSPADWRTRLGEGLSNFDEMFARAMAGDEDALSSITQYADELLRMGSDLLGPSVAYAELFDYVTSALESLQAHLSLIEDPGAGGSYGGGTPDSPVVSITTDDDKYRLALQIAGQIGAIGFATGADVFALLDEFGIPLLTLIDYMRIDLDKLTMEGLTNLGLLATALNIDLVTLMDHLGIDYEQVAELFGLNADAVREGFFEGLYEFSQYMGIPILDALGLIGVDVQDVVSAVGYEIGELSDANWDTMKELARLLGLDVMTLAELIGEDLDLVIGNLADDLDDIFSILPDDLPEAIKDELDELFVDLGNATSPEEVKKIMDKLFLLTRDNLPASFGDALEDVFTAMGFTPPDPFAVDPIQDSILSESRRTADNSDGILSESKRTADNSDGILSESKRAADIGADIHSTLTGQSTTLNSISSKLSTIIKNTEGYHEAAGAVSVAGAPSEGGGAAKAGEAQVLQMQAVQEEIEATRESIEIMADAVVNVSTQQLEAARISTEELERIRTNTKLSTLKERRSKKL